MICALWVAQVQRLEEDLEADEVAASSKVVPTAASEAAAKAKEAAGMHAEVHDVKVSYAEAMTEHLEGLIEMLSTAGAGGEQRLPQRTGCVQCPQSLK